MQENKPSFNKNPKNSCICISTVSEKAFKEAKKVHRMLSKSHPAASLKEIKEHLRLAIHGHVISDIKKQTFHKPERKFNKNEYCQSQMKEDLEGT